MACVVLFAVTRSITDEEDLSGRSMSPFEVKTLIKATNDIFWAVTTTISGSVGNELSDTGNIITERLDGEPIRVAVVSVSNERNSDLEAISACRNVRDYLLKGLFGSVDPGTHRACAVAKQADLQQLDSLSVFFGLSFGCFCLLLLCLCFLVHLGCFLDWLLDSLCSSCSC
jgi:hypothetical protein